MQLFSVTYVLECNYQHSGSKGIFFLVFVVTAISRNCSSWDYEVLCGVT